MKVTNKIDIFYKYFQTSQKICKIIQFSFIFQSIELINKFKFEIKLNSISFSISLSL